MKTSSLWRISVTTSLDAEEAVASLLERLFGSPASVYVPQETQEPVVTVFSTRPAERALSKREALQAGLSYIADSGLNLGPAHISIRRVPREDWAESWKKHFKPIAIGDVLLIKPSWSKRQARAGQATVILDPGLSFGTGQHPTTRFCLQQIAKRRAPETQQSCLDIGTGSGLLAIAAAKVGYRPVRAFDNDPAAVRTAKANAKKNHVLDQIEITRGHLEQLSLKPKAAFHLVCANLIDTILIHEKLRIANRVRPEGFLVLAGILRSQFPAVRRAYETIGFQLIATKAAGEWQSGTFTRTVSE